MGLCNFIFIQSRVQIGRSFCVTSFYFSPRVCMLKSIHGESVFSTDKAQPYTRFILCTYQIHASLHPASDCSAWMKSLGKVEVLEFVFEEIYNLCPLWPPPFSGNSVPVRSQYFKFSLQSFSLPIGMYTNSEGFSAFFLETNTRVENVGRESFPSLNPYKHNCRVIHWKSYYIGFIMRDWLYLVGVGALA